MTSPGPRVRPRSLVQVAHYPPGSTFGPRPLRDFEFVWVLRGTARWRVTDSDADGGGGSEVELRPGTLALARPGTTDTYRWDDQRASAHAYVHFDADQAPGRATQAWPRTRAMAGHNPLSALCSYLLDLASVGGPAERARSDQIVGLLLDLFLVGPFPDAQAGLMVPPPLLPALERVRQVWDTQGVRSLRVPELAAAARMSPGHFSRTFTAAFGCGPATGLELVRLARAATTLQRSNLSISEVARHYGFADAYHFSKRFAAAYQLPPGRFRRRGEEVDPLGPLAARGLFALWASLTGAIAPQSDTGPSLRPQH